MINPRLHEKWARRLGINPAVSRIVDKAIDKRQPDRAAHEVMLELADLRAKKKEDFDKAVILHVLLDKLRDFLAWLLGEGGIKPIELLLKRGKAGLLLDVAKMLAIDTQRLGLNEMLLGLTPPKIDEVIEELRQFAEELVRDILHELRLTSEAGKLRPGKRRRKYIRYVINYVPELGEFIDSRSL